MGLLIYSRNIVEFLRMEELAEEVAYTDRYEKFNSTFSKKVGDELSA